MYWLSNVYAAIRQINKIKPEINRQDDISEFYNILNLYFYNYNFFKFYYLNEFFILLCNHYIIMNKINDKKFGLQFIMNFIKFIFVLEVLCKVKIPYLKLKTELIKIIFHDKF